jgi:nitrogen-specific signal transduction histidine kinase
LADGLAHDFCNVIAGIIGSAEMIRMDAPPEAPDNPSLDQIFTAGGRASHMIQLLREFSQRKPCHRKLLHLPPVIEESLKLIHPRLPTTAEILRHLEPQCPAILADAAQIRQAVTSLCVNASHSLAGKKGRIEVRLETCDVDAQLAAANPGLNAGPHVRLSVHDSGDHFYKSVLGRIFEPFACKHSDGHDSGLELFTVREIVHAHEGTITVDSAPGEGTVFRLYFPIPANADGGQPLAE